METIYDVQQLLKKFDILIYMKNRIYMLNLYGLEIAELYRLKLIDQSDYLKSVTIIKRELRILKEEV
ncbi:YqgQ family protein [Gemelliphila asaccharolytica]|uniref:DUF910 family protein n=1 Tax=Gemelliphila asaccharolytica TaxID=502393 RepID=A0ABR5TMT7_9BACL|nr:YqgQ family protein [Gemella asaccharolytica]KXB58650.1 hypothetical protein HMPREF1871_00416 [Gemella asaccharolytica]